MIVLLAAHVSTNAPLEQSLKAKSTQLTLNSALSAAPALMHVPAVLSLSKENHTNTKKPLQAERLFVYSFRKPVFTSTVPKKSAFLP